MKKDELGEVKVFRFDPAVDKELRYLTYKVPCGDHTVLNALVYIYEHYDRTLAFRAGCVGKGSGRCGVCPVLVDGTPAFSCQTIVKTGMTIGPHPKFALIKDLAVDFNRVNKDRAKTQSNVEVVVDVEKCIGCNDCVLICPVGVYQLKKVGGKNKAAPVDAGSCCGLSCQLCVTHCHKDAITVKPR